MSVFFFCRCVLSDVMCGIVWAMWKACVSFSMFWVLSSLMCSRKQNRLKFMCSILDNYFSYKKPYCNMATFSLANKAKITHSVNFLAPKFAKLSVALSFPDAFPD